MHHYYWNSAYPGAWMIAHGAFWIVLLVGLLIGTAVLVRSLRSSTKGQDGPTALDILDHRYARGDIDRDEYVRRKSDILERKTTASASEE
jgi:putative membrane protein